MKNPPACLPSLASALTLILAAGPATIANAETIFTQDFEAGLGLNESTFGMFSINNTLVALNNRTMMMGHAVSYGPLGSGETPLPSYSYYELVLDLRDFSDVELRFDFSGGIEKDFDGFNLLATTEEVISPPGGLILPTAGSAFQYDADLLIIHDQSSPELGATAWSSPTDTSTVVKGLAAVFDLSAFDGEEIIVRFQFGTDSLEGGDGANFDNIVVEGTALSNSGLAIETMGDDLVFTWESAAGQLYNLRSETDPSAGETATWSIFDGRQDIQATPPLNTLSILRPADAERFFLLESFPKPRVTLLDVDFESGQGGFTAENHTAGVIWAFGDPDSTGDGGTIDTGNGGSTNCWGTDISNPGFYVNGTDTSLISPVIDLTGVTGTTLSFAQAIDILAPGDTLVVNIIDDTTDTVIEAAIHTSTDGNDLNADWKTVYSIAIAGGEPVRIEWRFTGDGDDTYMGAYIDNVLVTAP